MEGEDDSVGGAGGQGGGYGDGASEVVEIYRFSVDEAKSGGMLLKLLGDTDKELVLGKVVV